MTNNRQDCQERTDQTIRWLEDLYSKCRISAAVIGKEKGTTEHFGMSLSQIEMNG